MKTPGSGWKSSKPVRNSVEEGLMSLNALARVAWVDESSVFNPWR